MWNLSPIAKMIDRQFGKSRWLAAVSRIRKLLGSSAQEPLYQTWQQDAYPQINVQARAAGAPTLPMKVEFDPTTTPERLGRLWVKRQSWRLWDVATY